MFSSFVQIERAPVVILADALLMGDEHGFPIVGDAHIRQTRTDAQRRNSLALSTVTSKYSIVIRDTMIGHYFHFVESLLVLFAAQREFFPATNLERIYVGTLQWNNPRQANVQRELLALLFPNAEIVTDLGPEPIMVETLLYVDRRLTQSALNKMIEPVLPMVTKWASDLRSVVWEALRIIPRPAAANHERSKVLYVVRKPPRSLTPEVERMVIDLILPEAEIATIDFAGMQWVDQVRAAADCDVMLGVHGNGLTNLLWLPRHATVIEMFPEGVHHYDYQMLSEAMDLDYFGIEGSKIFRPLSRQGAAYGHNGEVNKPISSFQPHELSLALRSHKRRLSHLTSLGS